MVIGVKSNSKTVAFIVFETPNAFCKSESPVQLVDPSLNMLEFGPIVDVAFPVLNTIPFAKGKPLVPLSK